MINTFAAGWTEDIPDVDEESIPMEDFPATRKLSELRRPAENDVNELLKDRFLCRGGSLLFTGPTGVGKSSLALQLACCWALGKEAFGINPNGKLRMSFFQAENDDGDMAEMRDGIIAGLGLSPEDSKEATDNISVIREDSRTGAEFCEMLDTVLEAQPPDLIFIDPILAYLGGDASAQRDVSYFLRNLLNPVLCNHHCGAIVVHHVNKPPSGKEKPNWQAGEFAYSGSGSAEFANWARGVIGLRSVGSHEIFELRLGKRGRRVGWKHDDGVTPAYAKRIAHSEKEGEIFWREISETEQVMRSAGDPDRNKTKLDILPLIPLEGTISKAAVISKAQTSGIGMNKVKGFIAELISDGALIEVHIPRSRTRPEVHLSHPPQPVVPDQ